MNEELLKRLKTLGYDVIGEDNGVPIIKFFGEDSDTTTVFVKNDDGTTQKLELRAAQLMAK